MTGFFSRACVYLYLQSPLPAKRGEVFCLGREYILLWASFSDKILLVLDFASQI